MFETLIRFLFIGASAIAGGLGAYVLLSAIVNLARWIFERRRPRWLQMVSRSRPSVQSTTPQSSGLTRWILLAVSAGLALKAGLTGGLLVAIFLVTLGLALYLYMGERAGSTARERTTDAIGELVAAYYSAYLVIPTVFGALAEAVKTQVDPHLQNAVRRALDAFGTGKTSEEVLDQLDREVQNPYLSQFVFILGHTAESNQGEILNTLRELTNRLDQRKRLKDRSRVALALVSGTVRFLQASNGAVMALAVLAPFWWDFYSSSISRQTLLIIGGTIALLGSWYFENELMRLRERVL